MGSWDDILLYIQQTLSPVPTLNSIANDSASSTSPKQHQKGLAACLVPAGKQQEPGLLTEKAQCFRLRPSGPPALRPFLLRLSAWLSWAPWLCSAAPGVAGRRRPGSAAAAQGSSVASEAPKAPLKAYLGLPIGPRPFLLRLFFPFQLVPHASRQTKSSPSVEELEAENTQVASSTQRHVPE